MNRRRLLGALLAAPFIIKTPKLLMKLSPHKRVNFRLLRSPGLIEVHGFDEAGRLLMMKTADVPHGLTEAEGRGHGIVLAERVVDEAQSSRQILWTHDWPSAPRWGDDGTPPEDVFSSFAWEDWEHIDQAKNYRRSMQARWEAEIAAEDRRLSEMLWGAAA